jgi:hypothetical protein
MNAMVLMLIMSRPQSAGFAGCLGGSLGTVARQINVRHASRNRKRRQIACLGKAYFPGNGAALFVFALPD